ncbi:MAG: hypothetical protein WA655_23340 [Candidatus Korobacteraceae bacterium]
MTALPGFAITAAGAFLSLMLVLALLIVGLAICGWVCVCRTDALVKHARKQYEEHPFIRLFPFSGLVMKSWYPTYLRCSGVFVWIWDAVLIYLVWGRRPR